MKSQNQNNRLRKVNNQKRRRNGNGNGRKLSQIISTNAPVSRSNRISFRDPQISSIGRSKQSGVVSCNIRHRELIAVIPGSVAFAVSEYPVQPGLSTSFPWLSTIANKWEMYRFNSIAFRFISRSSTAFTGTVSLAPDYDSSDDSPTSYQQLSSYQGVVSDSPWTSILCQLSPRATQLVANNRYIRSSVLSDNQDIKLYDVANFFIATVGQAGTSSVGELWVEYDVVLSIPQIVDFTSDSNLSSGTYTGAAGVDTTHLLGTAQDSASGNLTISSSGNVVTIANLVPGVYYIAEYSVTAVTTLTTAGTMAATTGFSSVTVIFSVTNSPIGMMSYKCLPNLTTGTITLGGYTVLTGGGGATFIMTAFIPVVV
jgi:hypothetical protein